MHELSITRNIVAIVGEAAQGRRVRQITVEIGQLSGVMSEAVAFCFEAVAQGSAIEGAVLDILEVAGRARCVPCGAEFETPSLLTRCPCGSATLVRLQGQELNIKSMELEEAA